MSEAREKARALLAAATPGPWIPDGEDVWVGRAGKLLLARPVPGCMDADMSADAALIAAAPTLIVALIAEADASERDAADAHRVVESSIQNVHAANERADAAERRAVEAEAGAAALASSIQVIVPYVAATFPHSHAGRAVRSSESGDWGEVHMGRAGSSIRQLEKLQAEALATDAGRAIIDRLERAEAERDALRAENAELAVKVQRMEGRTEIPKGGCSLCDGLGFFPAGARSSEAEDCHKCGGSGAVIVEGET